MEVDDNIQIKSSKLAKKKITMIGNGHSFESDKRRTISEQSFNALECCQFSGTEHVCNSSIDDFSALDIGSKKPTLSLKSYISRKQITDTQRTQIISQSKFVKKRREAPAPANESA